jgi:hypothetical protein
MVSKLRATSASFCNEILSALSDSEIDLLRPHPNQVTLISGQVLHEPNSPITHQSAIKTTFLLYSAGSSARTAA